MEEDSPDVIEGTPAKCRVSKSIFANAMIYSKKKPKDLINETLNESSENLQLEQSEISESDEEGKTLVLKKGKSHKIFDSDESIINDCSDMIEERNEMMPGKKNHQENYHHIMIVHLRKRRRLKT